MENDITIRKYYTINSDLVQDFKEISYLKTPLFSESGIEAFLSSQISGINNCMIHLRLEDDNPIKSVSLQSERLSKPISFDVISIPVTHNGNCKWRLTAKVSPGHDLYPLIKSESISLVVDEKVIPMKFIPNEKDILGFIIAKCGLNSFSSEILSDLAEKSQREVAIQEKAAAQKSAEKRQAIEEKEKMAFAEQERIRSGALELAKVLLNQYESTANNCGNWSEDDFQKWIYENSWMSSNAIQECINRFSYSYFVQLLGVLKQKSVISEYQVLRDISRSEAGKIIVKINSTLFDRVSNTQLSDIINEKSTIEQVIQTSPIKPCINKVKTLINNKFSNKTIDSGFQSGNSGNVKNNQGCYIATCVYGSYDCPEVWTLRRFRDNVLKSSLFGRLFIKVYYSTSPSLVSLLGNKRLFQLFWKNTLDRLVHHLHTKGIDSSPYIDSF